MKTESSSTVSSPPRKLPPQPLTPNTKWCRLRAAAALSQERVQALVSLPVVSSTPQPQSSPSKIWIDREVDSEVHLLYLFQRAGAELFKTESSSTIPSLPPILPPQPLTPDTKWRRLRAAVAAGHSHCNSSRSRTSLSLSLVKLSL